MSFRATKAIAAALAVTVLVGTAGQAFADRNQYTHRRLGQYHGGGYGYHRRGIGPGAAIAGAALGIAGIAAAGVAANSYNGYPAYGYGPGYGPRYGYDYIPDHGYYGPY